MSAHLSDFTDCMPCSPLTISASPPQVVSKVTFEMSEEGEAQEKVQEAGIPLKLSLNRPFLFAVMEGHSSAILMLGKITNPTL